jgi:hypothetical protein
LYVADVSVRSATAPAPSTMASLPATRATTTVWPSGENDSR